MDRSSLGELVGLVIERDLITHCTFTKESVSVAIEKLQLTLSPDDAGTLLRLILRGAGVEDEHETVPAAPPQPPPAAPEAEKEEEEEAAEQPAADTYHKREFFRAAQLVPIPETPRVGKVAAEQQPSSGDGGAFEEQSVSEEYLDSVLSFALTMQIIEGYTKDRESKTVTLRTGATTTGLSYWETLEYLTNSMLYELRPRTEH